MTEEWKTIKSYEGYYEVSNLGNIRSLARVVIGKNGLRYHVDMKILKPGLTKAGYNTVSLHKNSSRKTFYIHKLVAEHFIPNLHNKRVVNHLDGNKTNNQVSNLEWATYSENSRHALATGLFKPTSSNKNGKVQGENNYAARLTEEDVRFIRNNTINHGGNISRKEMSETFGVGITTIANILYRRSWKHVI
ncbi:NUMOD4 domain-containing protein [Rummeliibacillus stabekisii]|uniref:NUMOD4 domain-containing protein n=1 Tax=Rummeliibacillus stabekisii TaxID=241244 RepID=UPI00371803A2